MANSGCVCLAWELDSDQLQRAANTSCWWAQPCSQTEANTTSPVTNQDLLPICSVTLLTHGKAAPDTTCATDCSGHSESFHSWSAVTVSLQHVCAVAVVWLTKHNTCTHSYHQIEDISCVTATTTDRALAILFASKFPIQISTSCTVKYVTTAIFSLKFSIMGNLMQLPTNCKLLSQLETVSSQFSWLSAMGCPPHQTFLSLSFLSKVTIKVK